MKRSMLFLAVLLAFLGMAMTGCSLETSGKVAGAVDSPFSTETPAPAAK